MNNKIELKLFKLRGRYWLLACALSGLLPGVGQADVYDTSWDVTGVSRIDVTAIRAPGMIPKHNVNIFDDTYTFAPSGFTSYGVDDGNNGTKTIINDAYWSQKITKKQKQYTVKLNAVDALALENQFKENLQADEPGIVIYQIKLISGKLTGVELDNGIWGSERFEYKVDSELDGFHDVVRVVRTTQLAGYPHATLTAAGLTAGVSAAQAPAGNHPRSSAVAAEVNAVLQHMRKRGTSAQ